ncbi:class I SAM-dependent methyltransferase [Bradyrhizobium sp. ORS 86]|uniref:class I SAM-dependent methyltransferase n=1 Tax=Bradyrhizobium sp. ORS 86 TaxID=1685970 RepID=UPI0038901B4F
MKLDGNQIRDYWRNQALTFGADHRASWTDVNAINLEITEISKRLRDGMKVIDIGCANGFSTKQYAQRFKIAIKGVDYVPEMIAAAKTELAQQRSLRGTASFAVGDINGLDEPTAYYDVAIVARVIINLPDRNKQVAAIREAGRTVKPGGLLLLSEATREGLNRLNSFRAEWAMPAIPEPAFNNYVDEDLVRSAATELLELEEISNFSSTYFIGTRIIKPLLARIAGDVVDPNRADMEWNRFFSMLPAAGDYGTQKLFVLRRT